MQGIILSNSCGIYSVVAEGKIFRLSSKGKLRHIKQKPLVGDVVDFDEQNLVILNIKPRKTELKRPLIANLDQLLIVQSLVEPEFSYSLIFKYLTYASMHDIPAKIILTKGDLFKDQAKLEEIVDVFESVNIPVFVISNKDKSGLDNVKILFKDNITCLMGQSGVGKSSLINAIDENFQREIGEYSMALGRGKHETKEVILLPYEGGYIADTPGFSSLDLGLFKEDLACYFPGFKARYVDCYFSNCLHLSENKCAIKEALHEGKISKIAYDCYVKLSDEAIFKSRRFIK